MATLGEEASQYEKSTTKNITDLKVVSTSFQMEDRTGKDKDNEEFKYNVAIGLKPLVLLAVGWIMQLFL